MTVDQTYINCKQTDKGDATMKSIPFKREARYVVFKLKDIHANLSAEQIAALQSAGETIAAGRAIAGKPPFNAVVVEQDWPEFEMVWNAIETRERDAAYGKQAEMCNITAEQTRQLASTEALLATYRAALEKYDKLLLAPSYARNALSLPSPQAALNNAIAEELERMAKVFEKQGWPFGADDLTYRAKELREMK